MAVAFDGTAVAAGSIIGGATLTLAKTTTGTNRVAVIGVTGQLSAARWITVAYGVEGLATQWARSDGTHPTTIAVLVNPPTASTNVVTTLGSTSTACRVVISSFNGVSLSPVKQKGTEITAAGSGQTQFDVFLPVPLSASSMGVDMVGAFQAGTAYNPTFMAPMTGAELNESGAGTVPNAIWTGAQYDDGQAGNVDTFSWFINFTPAPEVGHAVIELKQTDSDLGQPRFTAAAAAISGAGGTLLTGVPTHLADDVLVMIVETANQAVPSWPAGWTEFTNSPQGTGTAAAIGGVRISAAWHRCAAAGEAAPQLQLGTMNHGIARIFGIRGCITTGNPFNAVAGGVQATSTNAYTMPSVTTTAADCLIAYIGGFDQDVSTANVFSVTNQGTLDSAVDKVIDSFTATGVGGGLGMFYGVQKAAGASGTIGISAIANGTAAFLTIAFKPPGGAVNQVIVIQSLTTGVPALATGGVTQNHVIPASSLTAAVPTLASGAVSVQQEYAVDAQSLTTGIPEFAPGTVSQLHTINVNALATAPPVLTTGAVTGNHVAVAQSLTSAAPTLATGTVTQRHVVVAQSLTTSAPVLVASAITQSHVAVAQSLTSAAPVLATGAVTQKHVVVAAALSTAVPTLAAGTVTQLTVVVAQNLATAAPIFSTGAVTQKHVVVAAALTSAVPVLATGAVTQRHTIVLVGKTVGVPTVGLLTIVQRHVIASVSLTTAVPTLAAGAVTLAATYPGVSLATAAPVLVTGTITQAHVVAPSSLVTTAPTLATGAVTQKHTIVVASLTTAVPILAAGATGAQTAALPNPLTTAAPVLVSGAVTQRHVAVVAALATAAPTLTRGAFSQQHVAAVTALVTVAPTLITGAITQKHVIAPASLVTAVPSLVAAAIVVTLYLRPESDISAGGWTDQGGATTGLYAAVADKSAANFIQSSVSPAVTDIVVLKADAPPLVTLGQPFVVAYEYGKQTNNATRIDITARLMQGTTEIAAWTHTDVSSTLNVAQQTLTGGQFATISDAYALRFVLEATAP